MVTTARRFCYAGLRSNVVLCDVCSSSDMGKFFLYDIPQKVTGRLLKQ